MAHSQLPHPTPAPPSLSNPWGGALGSDRLHSMSCVPKQGPTSLLSPLVTGVVGVGREPHTEHVTKGTFAVMGVAAETGIAGCRALGIALHADSTWSGDVATGPGHSPHAVSIIPGQSYLSFHRSQNRA